MRRIILTTSLCMLLPACQMLPGAQQFPNNELKAQLKDARKQIRALESEQQKLQTTNSELKRVMAILDTEKASRVEQSYGLRLQIRKFTQTQIDGLKEFLVQSNLLDYVGEELFERAKGDTEAAVLVDLANPIPRRGSLVGVSGYFSKPTSFVINILRPLNDRFVVIWKSQPLEAQSGGLQQLRFPVSVGVEKNDVVAYDFPLSVGVKYDRGTGRTLVAKKSFLLGASVDPSSLKGGNEKRAYSLGVSAILE